MRIMRLYLIRHGQTVDNVAGRYAGSLDSALTAHGVLQARRLASHLAQVAEVKHIFSSNLQRAVKTAEAVIADQTHALTLVQLSELREQDFGSREGFKYGRAKGTREASVIDDAETAGAMAARVDAFLDRHLLPVLKSEADAAASCVVVAHGIILSVLFRSLCAKLPREAVTVSPEAQIVASWSNTGYLEGEFSVAQLTNSRELGWSSLRLHVQKVNCQDHLSGLKKTRGGIGNAKFDDKQTTIKSFFTAASKKRKLEDAAEGSVSTGTCALPFSFQPNQACDERNNSQTCTEITYTVETTLSNRCLTACPTFTLNALLDASRSNMLCRS